MEELKRLADAIEKLDSRQQEHNATLVRLTVSVEDHVRRSNLLEENQGKVVERVTKLEESSHKARGAFWAMSAIGGALLTLHQLGLL